MMSWDIFTIVGTIAFSISGVLIAMEEDYDLIGFYALGFITAFGGGAIRNLLIGVPVTALWSQGSLFMLTGLLITIAYILPINNWVNWKYWNVFYGFMDAIGLAAFAIQGALYAKDLNLPASAIITSALLTGVGGGIIRDVLSKRQPFVFKYDLYAFWALLAGVIISLGVTDHLVSLYLLFFAILSLRMLSLQFGWHIPKRKRHATNSVTEEQSYSLK